MDVYQLHNFVKNSLPNLYEKRGKELNYKEILSQDFDTLVRRWLVQQDWMVLYASSLDGIDYEQKISAGVDGCRQPTDIRNFVQTLINRNKKLQDQIQTLTDRIKLISFTQRLLGHDAVSQPSDDNGG